MMVRERISRGDAKLLQGSDPQPLAPYKYLIWISTEHTNRGLEAEDRIFSGALHPPD